MLIPLGGTTQVPPRGIWQVRPGTLDDLPRQTAARRERSLPSGAGGIEQISTPHVYECRRGPAPDGRRAPYTPHQDAGSDPHADLKIPRGDAVIPCQQHLIFNTQKSCTGLCTEFPPAPRVHPHEPTAVHRPCVQVKLPGPGARSNVGPSRVFRAARVVFSQAVPTSSAPLLRPGGVPHRIRSVNEPTDRHPAERLTRMGGNR